MSITDKIILPTKSCYGDNIEINLKNKTFRVVPNSNRGPETGYPGLDNSRSSSVPPDERREGALN